MRLVSLFSLLPLALLVGPVFSAPTAADASVEAPPLDLQVRDSSAVAAPTSGVANINDERSPELVARVPVSLNEFIPTPGCWDCLLFWASYNGIFSWELGWNGKRTPGQSRWNRNALPYVKVPQLVSAMGSCASLCYDNSLMQTYIGDVGFTQTLWDGTWIYQLLCPFMNWAPPPPPPNDGL